MRKANRVIFATLGLSLLGLIGASLTLGETPADLSGGGQAFEKLKTFDTQANCFCFAPDGKSLLMGTLDGVVQWDIDQNKSVGEWKIGHTPQCIAVAPDGSWAAVGAMADTNDDSKSRILARIDLKNGGPVRTIPGGRELVRSYVRISADGKTLWHAPGDGQIQQVDAKTWSIERIIKLDGTMSGAVFAANCDSYASLLDEIGWFSQHRAITFGDLHDGRTSRNSSSSIPSYLVLGLSNDGGTLALRKERTIHLWQKP